MKKNTKWIKIAIYSSGYGIYSTGMVIPLLSAVLNAFPNTGTFTQSMFLTGGASISALITAFISGILVKYVTKRKLLIGGTALFFLGGIGSFFATDMKTLVVMRMLDGTSDGICLTVISALIAELFHDEKERSAVYGTHMATASIFSMITSGTAGILCLYGWRYGFLASGLSLFSIILVWLFIPDTPLERSKQKTTYKNETKLSFFKCITAVLMFIIITTLMTTPYLLLDVYISENGLGDSVLTGTITSISSLLSFIASLIFPFIYMRTKNIMLPSIILVFGLSMIIMHTSNYVIPTIIGVGLSGLETSFVFLHYQMYLSQNASPYYMGFFMGLYTVAQYAASFLSPYVPSIIHQFLKNINSTRDSYLIIGVLSIFIAILYFLQSYANRIKTTGDKR